MNFNDCTKFWQAPVDELHSIENKGDRVAKILIDFARRRSKNTLVL